MIWGGIIGYSALFFHLRGKDPERWGWDLLRMQQKLDYIVVMKHSNNI